MADAVLLYQDKSATGGLWKAVDTTTNDMAEGGSPDAALQQLALRIKQRAIAVPAISAPPAHAIYALMLAKGTSWGNIAANEFFTGSTSFDVTFILV